MNVNEELQLDINRVSRFIAVKVSEDVGGSHHLQIKHFVELLFVENLSKKLQLPLVYNGHVRDLPCDPKSSIVLLVPFIDLYLIEPEELKNQVRKELGLTKHKDQEQLESTPNKD